MFHVTMSVHLGSAHDACRTSALTDNIDVMVMLPHHNTYLFSYQRVSSPAIQYAIKTIGRAELLD